MEASFTDRMLRYEVDLEMIRRWVPEADGRHLALFCANLERVMREGNDPVRVVPTFWALNDPTDRHLVAWGWPTVPEWRRAVEETFGVLTLPTRRERRS